jgi:LysM repeat protein
MGVSSGNVKTKEYPDKPGVEYYGVLRGAQSVGVPMYLLTEHSFHTNIAAAKWLLNEDNLKKLAKLKVEILADWFGLKKKAAPKPQPETKPDVKPETKPSNDDYEVYVVKSGDSLSKIAAKYDTTWQELAEYNNLDNPNKIYVGQEIKIPKKKEEIKEDVKVDRTYKFNEGDIVNFKGNTHYANANAATGSACKAGKAKVTARYDGKHPYHLVAEKDGKSNVWGWVDESNVEAWVEPSKDEIKVGDKVKIKSGVNTYSNGVAMKSWVKTSVLYVRNIEKNGTVYLVSTQKTANVYTGRVRATDVYKI